MLKKETISDILVVAALAAFAYYKYKNYSEDEKAKLHNGLKETGRKILKDVVPEQLHTFIPATLK